MKNLLRRLGLLSQEQVSTVSSAPSEPTLTTSTLTVSLADEPIWDQMRRENSGVLSRSLHVTGLNVSVELEPRSDNLAWYGRNPFDTPHPVLYRGHDKYLADTNSYGVDLGSYVETYGTEDEARTAAKQQDKPFVVKNGDDPLADFLEEE